MSYEPRRRDEDTVVAATAWAQDLDDDRGITDEPIPLDVEIRNLNRGQLIEMHVRGPWTEAQLEERLLRFVSARQPAELLVRIEPQGTAPEPLLERPRAEIEAIGGTLRVCMSPSPTTADSR